MCQEVLAEHYELRFKDWVGSVLREDQSMLIPEQSHTPTLLSHILCDI